MTVTSVPGRRSCPLFGVRSGKSDGSTVVE
jgi:hypothetical protein